MLVQDRDPAGIVLYGTRRAGDGRGTFCKWFESGSLSDFHMQQMNFVTTTEALVLRGLHFQESPWAEAKFFRAVQGAVQLAVARVDGREDGDFHVRTFLLDHPDRAVLVPRGFATGYLTLTPSAQVLYLSNNPYQANSEGGFRWDDPRLAIPWVTAPTDTSEKDANWPLL